MRKTTMMELSPRAQATLEQYRSAEGLSAERKHLVLEALRGRIARGEMPSVTSNVEPPVSPAAAPKGLAALTKILIGVGLTAGIAIPLYFVLRESPRPSSTVPEVRVAEVASAPVVGPGASS